ncbi:MAG: hypothetical protein DRP42_05860, partial [Tenericutes bacterium]
MGLIGKIIEGIRNFFRIEERETASTPRSAEELKIAKLKEIGRLKGELGITQKKLIEERKKTEHLTKLLKGEDTLAEKIEKERAKLKGFRREDVLFLNQIPQGVVVLEKFHRRLGYLYGFFIDKDTGYLGLALTEKPKGKNPYFNRAWLSPSLRDIIHHPENLKEMLE